MTCTFSVIMTSYNYGAYIGKAIDSVISQTFKDWELIVVDDCSSDLSWEVIQGFEDPRIKKYRFEENRGACAAYNFALAQVSGKYIASLDSDDMFAPSKLEKQLKYFVENPDIDICGTWIDEIDSDGNSILNGPVANWFNRHIDLNLPESWIWQNRLCHSSSVIRKEVHYKVGQSRCNLVYTPDLDFWIRSFVAGARFGIIEEALTVSRQHTRNITHQFPYKSVMETADISSRFLNQYLASHGRFDLIEENFKGFLRHPLAEKSTDVDMCEIVGKALGVEQSMSSNQVKLVSDTFSYLLRRVLNLESEIVKKAAEWNEVAIQRDSVIAERDLIDEKNKKILSSLSWRITRPLRYVWRVMVGEKPY